MAQRIEKYQEYYFKRFITENRTVINTCCVLKMNICKSIYFLSLFLSFFLFLFYLHFLFPFFVVVLCRKGITWVQTVLKLKLSPSNSWKHRLWVWISDNKYHQFYLLLLLKIGCMIVKILEWFIHHVFMLQTTSNSNTKWISAEKIWCKMIKVGRVTYWK